MILPEKKCEVERCITARRDRGLRPVLDAVYLRITGEGSERKGTLEATDSYKAISVPVEVSEHDVQGPIPTEALRAARKCAPKFQSGMMQCGPDSVIVLDGSVFPRPNMDVYYPDLPKLMDFADSTRLVVTLSAAFLADIAKGVGGDMVSLSMVVDSRGDLSPLRPIHIKVRDGEEGAVALLMPIRTA